MNKREVLIFLIKKKGKCDTEFVNLDCAECPFTMSNISTQSYTCSIAENIDPRYELNVMVTEERFISACYKKALNMYENKYGLSNLVEDLL